MKYLDVLINGNDIEKNAWTFKLIDQEKKGYFTLADFSSLFESLLHVWVSMTGNQISKKNSDFFRFFTVFTMKKTAIL